MDEILSDDFLKKITKTNIKGESPLHIYAADLDYYLPKINQLRRMWKELPDNIRKNKDFYKSMHSTKGGQFQGAVAELISCWVLGKYFKKIIKDLSVGKHTPDFFCEKDEIKLLFETFSLGQTFQEKKDSIYMRKLRKELEVVESSKGIYLVGGVHPNERGDFEGMGMELNNFLLNCDVNDDSDHTLTVGGARISFSVFNKGDNGPVLCGRIGGVSSGDSHAEQLLSGILKKKEKYSFPHIEICVIDSSIRLSHESIIKCLIGDEQIHFDRKTFKQLGSSYTNDGFWGIKNSNLDKNLHVQAFIFVWIKHFENTEFQLEICCAENHHLSTIPSLKTIFSDIPNLFKESRGSKLTLKVEGDNI